MPGSTAPSPPSSDAEEQPSEALLRVRRGELSLEAYLETLVEGGVGHLKGRMPDDRLDLVRNVLRDALRENPEFQETVRILTERASTTPS